MADYFSPDQLFAYIAHWRGLLDEPKLLALERLFEQRLDAGTYQPLGELAQAAGYITAETRELIERWMPLAELRLEDAYFTQQLASAVPSTVIDEAFILQENQFVADGSLVSVLDILLHNELVTPETIEALAPFPATEDDDDDGEYDDDHAPADGDPDGGFAMSADMAAGLLDLVKNAGLPAGLDNFEDEDNPDLGPDLLDPRPAPAPATTTNRPSGISAAAEYARNHPDDGDDDSDFTQRVLGLGYAGDPDPETDTGVPFGEKYELYREIDRGAHGVTYLGRQTNLGRLVLIRMLPKAALRMPELIQRFREKSTKAGKVLHPNLSQIFEVGQVGGRHFVAMEYVQGTPVTDLVRQRKRLPAREAVEIALGVVRALEAGLKAGLVHGDVRLDNIIVTADHGIKLIGLGLSGAIMPSKSAHKGLALIAPHFCPPEVALGEEPTFRSDGYSLGICLFVMLTGAFPYFGPRREVILEKHTTGPIRRPSEILGAQTPTLLDKLVHRLLQKIPGERFDDYEQLVAVLEKAQKIAGVPPPPVVAPPPAGAGATSPTASPPSAVPALRRKGKRRVLRPPTQLPSSDIAPPAATSDAPQSAPPRIPNAPRPRRRRRRR